MEAQGQPIERKWKLTSVGANWTDGFLQYVNGFNNELLFSNARAGLPVHTDWNLYGQSVSPVNYFQFGTQMNLWNSKKKVRIRPHIAYSRRGDTLFYTSIFSRDDTILGRTAHETTTFITLGSTFLKSSKLIWKTLRFYGGADVELAFAPTSKVDYWEYQFDLGDETFVELAEWHVKGKPRINLYLSAVIGFEVHFLKYVGLFAEVKSGMGGHFILVERPGFLSKTVYSAGFNVYWSGYQD